MTTEETTKSRAARGSLLCVLPLTLMIAGAIKVFATQETASGSTTQAPALQGEAARESDVEIAYVTVLDRKGNTVTDLKREEFSISENKVQQEIIEVASAAETPLVIATMVDLSGSTRSDNFGEKQLQAFASFFSKTLQSSDEASVAVFADRAVGLTGLTNNLAELQGGLKKIRQEDRHGSTALYDCLVSAAETMPKEPGRRKVILVMGDFQDNTSRHSLESTVMRMQGTGTAVFPLVEMIPLLQSKRARKQALEAANEIAKESGGAAFVFEKPQGLETALEQIRGVLRNSYAVKYHASGEAKKGKRVAVKIDLQRKDVVVIAARGRVAEVR